MRNVLPCADVIIRGEGAAGTGHYLLSPAGMVHVESLYTIPLESVRFDYVALTVFYYIVTSRKSVRLFYNPISIKMQSFSFTKICLKMSSSKWWPFFSLLTCWYIYTYLWTIFFTLDVVFTLVTVVNSCGRSREGNYTSAKVMVSFL